jgi:tellurite resistance protein
MDGETPDAAAWLDYERPVDAVRALFFDTDLAVRAKIHRGVRLQWLPRAPDGERRLRRHTRVLDKLHTEEVVIEAGPDGAWTQRFVEGPSAGTRFVATFESLLEATGPASTRVRMHARVGPKGFAQGLGKLSPIGLEKAMKRMLAEFKLALVGYEPGRARGAVTAVLAGLRQAAPAIRSLDDADRKRVTGALLETAWSIACADDGPNEAERDAMRAVVRSLWDTTLKPEVEDRMVTAAVQAIERQGVEERCSALGAKLRAQGFGKLGVQVAVLVAEVSCGLEPSELYALRVLAEAAGMGDDELKAILRTTEEALSGGDPLSRMSTFV